MAHLFKNLPEHVFNKLGNSAQAKIVRYGEPVDVVIKFIQVSFEMDDVPVHTS